MDSRNVNIDLFKSIRTENDLRVICRGLNWYVGDGSIFRGEQRRVSEWREKEAKKRKM